MGLHKNDIQLNAIELLKKIVTKRNWHAGKIDRKLASKYKLFVFEERLSYTKACEILQILGYTKSAEEVWSIPE